MPRKNRMHISALIVLLDALGNKHMVGNENIVTHFTDRQEFRISYKQVSRYYYTVTFEEVIRR